MSATCAYRGGGRTGGLSLATGTSQAPQFVAPEANIRRDDHRGLHDARRRFNLAKSHGAPVDVDHEAEAATVGAHGREYVTHTHTK